MADSQTIPEKISETIHPGGDLFVATTTHIFLVRSQELRRSTFFAAALEPGRFLEGAKEPSQDKPPTVDLDEDRTEEFRIWLMLLHLEDVTEESLNVERLMNLVNICDFYGTRSSIKHYVYGQLLDFDISLMDLDQLRDVLWPIWFFKFKSLFKKVTKTLITSMEVQEFDYWKVHPSLERTKGTCYIPQ